MAGKRLVTREDILPMETYARDRKQFRQEAIRLKRHRRMAVGPHATFYFESFDTMWHQIHEMLHVEKGGEEMIQGELDAYNPLIPNGRELVATVMFEISDPDRRARILGQLGGVEETMSVMIGGDRIAGVPEIDVDRTNAAGKASSVQFVRFPLEYEHAERFRTGQGDVVVAIEHPGYGHMAVMPDAVRRALATDLDET